MTTLMAAQPTSWPSATGDVYADALLTGAELFLHGGDTGPVRLNVSRWCRAADSVDYAIVDRCEGPVLDVGCGPGRITVAVAEQGLPALGIDIAPAAVAKTRAAGAMALARCVFDRLPGQGRWGTVLLIDGNIGIGGLPSRLLRRCAQLLRPDGRVIVEVEPGEVDHSYRAFLADSAGRRSPGFRWARLGPSALVRRADAAGMRCLETVSLGGRVFCVLAAS